MIFYIYCIFIIVKNRNHKKELYSKNGLCLFSVYFECFIKHIIKDA